MSKQIRRVGPALVIGIADNIRAKVLAVAIWPSSSTRSMVAVGKYGSTTVSERTMYEGMASASHPTN